MKIDRTDFNNSLLDYGFKPYQIKAIQEKMDKHIYPQIETIQVEAKVKPACINCKFLEIKGGLLLKDNTELCQNAKIGLWNLTNCDIDIHKWGCNYFESKSV